MRQKTCLREKSKFPDFKTFILASTTKTSTISLKKEVSIPHSVFNIQIQALVIDNKTFIIREDNY